MARSALHRLALLLLVPALAACERGRGVDTRFVVATQHEGYASLLRETGLHETALGRDWFTVAARSLLSPIAISLPHLEQRFLDPSEPTATAYRIPLDQGQLLRIEVESDAPPSDIRLFLDLFYASETRPPDLVASADSLRHDLEYVALRRGTYVLRLQPELLRGGRLTITVSTHASMGFPVAGSDMGAIRSGFGAPRDGGSREHHGVDIFARRGTPVVAAVAGRARASTNRLGGNVVWLRDATHGRTLYYAHLDRHAFSGIRHVQPGDTIGFIGNSGNARSTPPHLHFGIYLRRRGPVAPDPHLYEPPDRPVTFAGDPRIIGSWARTVRRVTHVWSLPSSRSGLVSELALDTPVEVLAGSGEWYHARLPDGREGYVSVAAAEALRTPVSVETLAQGSLVRVQPTIIGRTRDTIVAGDRVPVLGTFGTYAYVRNAAGVEGWVPVSAFVTVDTDEDSDH